MAKVWNVLSLCDGISTGQVALEKAGIEYNYYAASEINKYCIKAVRHNYPGTFHLGDIASVKISRLSFDVNPLAELIVRKF